MWQSKSLIIASLVFFVLSGGPALADCPSADLTGDCCVNVEDFAVMADQWLTGAPCAPTDMVYIPGGEFEMGRHVDVGDGRSDELPIHAVLLDAFSMSKYLITNSQYCDYLNSAYPGQLKVVQAIVYARSDNSESYPYFNTQRVAPYSQIYLRYDGKFAVSTKGGRDMSDDPVVAVSWYGAVAYCNWRSSTKGFEACYNLSTWECDFSKPGYHLPTEAEWEYAARGGEHNPYYRFPWGDTISHSQANYRANPGNYTYDISPTSDFHPDWNDGISPYTSIVGSFAANGYGLYDMVGNVWEWCNDWYDSDYYNTSPYDNPTGPASGTYRVFRGGGFYSNPFLCRIATRDRSYPDTPLYDGFRIVLDADDCPSADLTGDCCVDVEDFAVMADQWLPGVPCAPDDMVYIPGGEFEMGRHVGDGYFDELPIHAVLLDEFFMSRFEITNSQYCDYLNSAYPGQLKVVGGVVYDASDSTNSYPYCNTHSVDTESQIDYEDVSGTFSVRTKGEPPRDMNADPVVSVSWYGAVAYCNWRSSAEGFEACYKLSTWECDFSKHGYRLPTEAEWEHAARGGEHNPYYRFPWGDTISHSQANYNATPGGVDRYDISPTSGFHPDWNDGIYPYTSVVGSFAANGYGLYDMVGNVWEWCNDWHDSNYYDTSPYDNPTGPASGTYRVFRGGSWGVVAYLCRVPNRSIHYPEDRIGGHGFRIVLD